MADDAQIQQAMTVAERMLKAVLKKIPKYVGKVRRFQEGGSGYIEIAISPEHMNSRASELTTAYADEYFFSVTAENIQEKAGRILKDFKVLLGVK